MIRVSCHTNLDLFNEQWPYMLPMVPRKGDRIESMTKRGDFRLSLEVVMVTWRYIDNGIAYEYVPFIELHDPHKRSIRDFYKWYAPLVGKSVASFI